MKEYVKVFLKTLFNYPIVRVYNNLDGSTLMSGESAEIREMAAMIVQDYLTGPWKKVTSSNIVLQRVNGGLSNWLYRVSLPPSFQEQVEHTGEPVQVLLRLHGQVNCENAFERLITESVIFTLLSERALGPKLHGVFPGGRIEEYIPARPLKTKELPDPKISKIIAERMAQIHSMNVPISKEPRWLYDSISKWLKKVKQELEEFDAIDFETQEFIKRFKSYDLSAELQWLRKFLAKLKSPVVFSHNDMQEGNLLVVDPYDSSIDDMPDIVLIDFEYCSYNHRGFDLANHFIEHIYDYTVSEYPNFNVTPSAYPTLEQQLRFIRNYLRRMKCEISHSDHHIKDNVESSANLTLQSLDITPRINNGSTDDDNNKKNSDNNKRHQKKGKSCSNSMEMTAEEASILMEIEYFTLASHLMWGVWAAAQAQSQIPFGYWEYCMVRLEAYFELKNKILMSDAVVKKRKVTEGD